MSRTTISQTEARALRKRVEQLEDLIDRQHNAYVRDYPGGVHIASVSLGDLPVVRGSVGTARRLSHGVVATLDGSQLHLYALPQPKVPA